MTLEEAFKKVHDAAEKLSSKMVDNEFIGSSEYDGIWLTDDVDEAWIELTAVLEDTKEFIK